MCDALSRLISLAPTLRGLEFKVLAQLTQWALEGRTAASYQDICDALKSSRYTTIKAVHNLEDRDLIFSDRGRRTLRKSEFRLLFYQVPEPRPAGQKKSRSGCKGVSGAVGTPERGTARTGGRA